MSEKELYRLQIMTQLEEKRITQKQAGELLGVSERHVKRLWRRFKRDGAEG
ncbi:helix-turn-helix domain-containing protein [Thermanaerothrix daxensis]|uniref:helix-turn-helix domain-containing protein n=1 Tax=Thermanaerothrix daxensis TaxID=869279 RepID=UPI0009F8188C